MAIASVPLCYLAVPHVVSACYKCLHGEPLVDRLKQNSLTGQPIKVNEWQSVVNATEMASQADLLLQFISALRLMSVVYRSVQHCTLCVSSASMRIGLPYFLIRNVVRTSVENKHTHLTHQHGPGAARCCSCFYRECGQ